MSFSDLAAEPVPGPHPSHMAQTTRDRSGLAAAAEAAETGRQTLARLGAQGEALEAAEPVRQSPLNISLSPPYMKNSPHRTVVDSNQYLIDKSGRLIRGMTWWGWLQNSVTAPPKPPQPVPSSTSSLDDDASTASSPSEEQQHRPSTVSQKRRDDRGLIDSPELQEQREYLKELSKNLDELRDVGREMGRAVETQAEQVPRLQFKIEALWEATTHVTRQAGRVTEAYATRAKPLLLCHVALREVSSRRYVRARGSELHLSDEVDVLRATSRFALFEKRPHLLGLQSTVSGKYVGITFSGAIACSSSRFGRWEEFDLDLQRPLDTPLLCVAANWGGGCWVRVNWRDRRLLPAEPRAAYAAQQRAGTNFSGNSTGRKKQQSDLQQQESPPCAAGTTLKRAARFEIVVLDDLFQAPSYAEEILKPKLERRRSRGTTSSGSSSSSSTSFSRADDVTFSPSSF